MFVMFTHPKKRASEVWKFHIADVQRRLRHEKSDAPARCCCANINPLLFFAFIVAVAVVEA